MRRFPPALLAIASIALAFLAIGSQATHSARAQSIQADAVIWDFDRDYPGAQPNDSLLPIHAVYVKTHDGTDWMSTWDTNPAAVSGPDSIRRLLDIYNPQGIDVAAWFVPYGTDVQGQLSMAEQVIDAGVAALYVDVEPFYGFCDNDCAFLAENFWRQLRAARPTARLGVIYDPRTWYWNTSATATWLSVADVAIPMCYWETFAGQTPWDDPAGCVEQARFDLNTLAPGRPLDYAPMLQGDSTPPRFLQALDGASISGASHVSVWRRGVVPADVWSAIGNYPGPATESCWVTLRDGCLIREASDLAVYLIEGGARFRIPDQATAAAMGLDWNAAQVVPNGFVATVPLTPVDGTLLSQEGAPPIYVVYGGAQFALESAQPLGPLGLDASNVRRVPEGGMAQISLLPSDYSRFRELTSTEQWMVVGGKRLALPDQQVLSALVEAGLAKPAPFIVPDGGMSRIPLVAIKRGDVSCDGTLDSMDALLLLQYLAKLPNTGACVPLAGNVDCNARLDATDVLLILRQTADLPVELPPSCPLIGSAVGAQ